ncbi:hypothetical protein HK102_009387, partial [Quaeritorhiza haematococci]
MSTNPSQLRENYKETASFTGEQTPSIQSSNMQSPISSVENTNVDLDMSQYRPLPEEIMRMSEQDTACQYCGISYLLLTKYERMKDHVARLEKWVKDLQDYAKERPTVLGSIDCLKKQHEIDFQTISDLKEKLTGIENEADQQKKLVTDLRNTKARVDGELTAAMLKICDLQSCRRRYMDSVSHQIQSIQRTCTQHRTWIATMKADVHDRFRHLTTTELPQLITHLLQHVQQRHAGVVASFTRQLQEKDETHTMQSKRLQQEIAALRQELQEREKCHELLVRNLKQTSTDQESHIRRQEEHIHNLQTALNEMHLKYEISTTNEGDLKKLHYEATRRLEQSEVEMRVVLEKEKTTRAKEAADANSTIRRLEAQLTEANARICTLQEEAADREKQRQAHGNNVESVKNEELKSLRTAIAQKDVQVAQLNKQIQECHMNLAAMREERRKTIEAHQSRIRQLQDKFCEDIKRAGQSE